MPTSLVVKRDFNPNHHTVEELLIELERFGYPKLIKIDDDGWYAKIEVFVTGKGVSFDVVSEFGRKTPKDSLVQCHERLISALQKIKDT